MTRFLLVGLVCLGLVPAVARAQVVVAVERVEPTSGPPGAQVDIVGRGFTPQIEVLLGDTPVEVVRRLPNRWTVRIPEGAQSAHFYFRLGERETQGPEFRVSAAAAAPVVERLEPTAGAPGTEVTIHGENFSARQTDNTVLLGERPVIVRSATPFALRVIVPEGAITAPFVVRVANAGEARSEPFAVQVGTAITSFTPLLGPAGTRVTITGTGFSPSVRDDRVFLGSAPCRVERATATELVVVLPRAATGPLIVDVRNAGRAQSAVPFVVRELPVIHAVEPASAIPGARVVLRGTGFGTDLRQVQVTLSGQPVTVRDITDVQLTVEVPAEPVEGHFEVTLQGLSAVRAPHAFAPLVPVQVTSFAPASAAAGAELTISGRGFSPNPAHDVVKIGNARCTIVSATSTELRVRVPAAPSGVLSVEVQGSGTVRSSQPFVVTRPPFIAGFEPARGEAGSTVALRGTGFGNDPAQARLTLAGGPLDIVSIADGRIVARIPEGARSGRIQVLVPLQGTAQTASDFEVVQAFVVRAVAPSEGHAGAVVVVQGLGFAATGMRVRFHGGAEGTVLRSTQSELRVVVPAGAQSGPIEVVHPDGRTVTPVADVDVAAAPAGVGISAVEDDENGRFRIVGWGFGRTAPSNRVTWGEEALRVRTVAPNVLSVERARGATAPPSGAVRVVVQGGGEATFGAPVSAGATADAGAPSPAPDAAAPTPARDASTPPARDAGPAPDAGPSAARDAGPSPTARDAGAPPAARDAGTPDVGPRDAGTR